MVALWANNFRPSGAENNDEQSAQPVFSPGGATVNSPGCQPREHNDIFSQALTPRFATPPVWATPTKSDHHQGRQFCRIESGLWKIWQFTVVIVSLLCFTALASCGDDVPKEESTSGTATMEVSSPSYGIVNMLRATGNEVEVVGDTLRPFFTPKAWIINVSNSIVQLYEYESKEQLEEEAATVSPDGAKIGSTVMKWEVPPHFYKTEKVIVLYEGNDSTMKQKLSDAVGTQFAGAP
jgi:hypothetical protein